MFDSMEGGDLSVVGNYGIAGGHSILTAAANINDYTIKGAPVVAKMLSLASFTGMFDTLAGKGIVFTKLQAPFTLSQDVITFTDAKNARRCYRHDDRRNRYVPETFT